MATRKSSNATPAVALDLPYCQPELLELFDLLVNVIFCIKNSDGRYLAVNNAFVRRTGRRSKRDVIGLRAVDLFAPSQAKRYEEQDAQVFKRGVAIRDELELIRVEDGSLGWYLTSKLPIRNGTGPKTIVGLASISRDLKKPRKEDLDARALARVVDYVRSNLATTIHAKDLAEVAQLSPAQLDRRMRKTFGLSPTKYLLRVRVETAAELLAETELPLAEVALAVGFYDQANLTHQFARLTNETPAQFRAHQQTNTTT